MHKIKNNPISDDDAVNKEYVDDKEKTLTYAEYQVLSEEEKNNGTTYFIPDLPISTNGEVIEEVEHLNGYLESNITGLTSGSVVPFVADTNSNITITNGLVTLKKGKTYYITCELFVHFTSSSSSSLSFSIKDTSGNIYGLNGYSCPNTTTYDGKSIITYSLTVENNIDIGIYINDASNFDKLNMGMTKLTITEIPNVQAMIDVSDDHIKEVAQEVYSTEEQIIGTWIDGKNVYRKTVEFGALPNATRKNVEHGISDIEKCIKIYGIANFSDGSSHPLPYVNVGNSSSSEMLFCNKTNVSIETGIDRSTGTAYVTLEYTKTSD
ncbi:MAG: hypothetical protein ACI4WU_04820 [Bacilli bacterium]